MTYRSIRIAALLCCFAPGLASSNELNHWPAWRGADGNGSVLDGNYPTQFNAEKYRWRTELPGKGCSTPILVDQRIYLTAPIEGKDSVLCFDLEGTEKWQTTFGTENAGKHRNGSGSNASPITDGAAVFVYFKSGTFAAVEIDGKIRWQTDLVERFGKDTLFWDHGTSPVLTEKHVIMARMHQGESWLAAFDKANGALQWKVARNYTTPVECDHGYTTPLVIHYEGKEAILVWGAEHVTIHDAADGKLMWSCGGFNPEANKLWPAIATPVLVGDVAIVAYGRNDRGIPRLHGIKLAGSGEQSDASHLWKRDDVGTFVPTPVVYQGQVIIVGDQGEVECIAADTGMTIWKNEFPKNRAKYYASPLIAGGKLYAPREDGVVMVASISDDKFTFLAENSMDESIIGSPIPISVPVASGNRILLRGERHLFCLGADNE